MSGTRCTTYIRMNNQNIAAFTRNYDGYLEGHGFELAKFLSAIKLTNGIRSAFQA